MAIELEAFHGDSDGWQSFRGRTSPTPPPATRDPMKWPYPSNSIWNMPIGEDAVLVPLGFNYLGDNASAASRVTIAEENILFLDPDAPQAYIKETTAGWDATLTRCGTRSGSNLTGNGTVAPRPVPIPTGFSTQPYIGTTPNMSGAVVYRSGTDIRLYETQPLHLCSDGVAVSQFINSSWVGDSIYTGGDGVKGGSHGGSYMTAFGGTIRMGEMLSGGAIKHAMKITLDTAYYCSASGGGFVWPALRADKGSLNYGSANPSVPSTAKMGMLLTVPNGFDPETMTTTPAKIIARAFKKYGAYLVDGDMNGPVSHLCQWQVERSNRGVFTTQFKNTWGYEFFHKPSLHGTPSAGQMAWRADIGNLMEAACIVTDNGPSNIGGAGIRRAPMAPALAVPA